MARTLPKESNQNLSTPARGPRQFEPSRIERELTPDSDRVRISSVDWSPDGQHIAAGTTGGRVNVWDAASGKLLHTLDLDDRGATHIRWGPRGARLASASASGSLRFWESGDVRIGDARLPRGLLAVDWSPSGDYLAAAGNGEIRIAGAMDGRIADVFVAPGEYLLAVAWSPGGRLLATGASDGRLRVRDVGTGNLLCNVEAAEAPITSIAWWKTDEYLATAADEGSIRLWDVGTGVLIHELNGHDDSIRDAEWSSDGSRLAAVSADGSISIWEISPPTPVRVLQTYADRVMAIGWANSESEPVVGSADGSIRAWNPDVGAYQEAFERHNGPVTHVSISPDRRWLASAGVDTDVGIWDLRARKFLGWVRNAPNVIDSVWLPGARLVLAREDGCFHVLDLEAQTEEAVQTSSADSVLAAGAYGDQIRLVGAEGSTVFVWHQPGQPEAWELSGHRAAVLAAALAPGCERLATGCAEGVVCIWSVPNRKVLRRFRASAGRAVQRLAWSPDGAYIAATALDGSARVWDVTTGHALGVWGHRQANRVCLSWSSDSTAIATSEGDGSVRIWDVLDGNRLCARARERVTRPLSAADRTRFGLSTSHR